MVEETLAWDRGKLPPEHRYQATHVSWWVGCERAHRGILPHLQRGVDQAPSRRLYDLPCGLLEVRRGELLHAFADHAAELFVVVGARTRGCGCWGDALTKQVKKGGHQGAETPWGFWAFIGIQIMFLILAVLYLRRRSLL